MNHAKQTMVLVASISAALLFGGCAGMSETQQRATTGAMGGAAGGALIGALTGNPARGAAIGAGVGGLGGFAYGRHREAVDRAYWQGRQSGGPR